MSGKRDCARDAARPRRSDNKHLHANQDEPSLIDCAFCNMTCANASPCRRSDLENARRLPKSFSNAWNGV
jgi:hypothetical protein